MTDSLDSTPLLIDLSELMNRIFRRKNLVSLCKSKGLPSRSALLLSTKRVLLEGDVSPLDLKRVAQQSNCGG